MLPWADVWRSALGMGLSPDAFWRLSLKEWRWLTLTPGQACAGADLGELMRAYPDTRLHPVPEEHV